MQPGEAFEKTRTFYKSCMAAGPDEREKILNQFRTIIDEAGGWSLSANDSFDNWGFMVSEEIHSFTHSLVPECPLYSHILAVS